MNDEVSNAIQDIVEHACQVERAYVYETLNVRFMKKATRHFEFGDDAQAKRMRSLALEMRDNGNDTIDSAVGHDSDVAYAILERVHLPDVLLETVQAERDARSVPQPLPSPLNLIKLHKLCAEYLEVIAEAEGDEDSSRYEGYIFDCVMTTIYGDQIFEWVNLRM